MPEFWAAMPDWIKLALVVLIGFLVYVVYTVLRYDRAKKKLLEMQNSLKVGDLILTQSGLYGRLESLDKTVARLKLAEGFTIVIDRFSIKGPARGEEKAAAERAQAGGKTP